jgi:hypothetical protein
VEKGFKPFPPIEPGKPESMQQLLLADLQQYRDRLDKQSGVR